MTEEVLYPSLSNKRDASDLIEDFQRQVSIELNPKSFSFSKIISDLYYTFKARDFSSAIDELYLEMESIRNFKILKLRQIYSILGKLF